jgi:radical SAM protein with 4Fe4S-binding SPASM domain
MFWKRKDIETLPKGKHSKAALKLLWVDEFIDNVKPYIFVRTEDNMLIKRPNQATKINSSAAQILKYLLDGGKIADLIKKVGEDKIPEVQNFMLALKQNLEGNLDEFSLNPAVEKERFGLGFSKLPVLSELALTYKCNLKCQFCYAGCNCTTNPAGSSKELSLAEFKQIIHTIYAEAKVPSISFTGGEPTLRPEILIGCTEYAKALGMRVNLITNGTLIDQAYAEKLLGAGLDSVQVSIEGTTATTHDTLVHHKGAFEKSINTVKIFKKLGIHVHTNTTLNKKNAEDCIHLPEFVKELGLDRFSMNLVIPTGSSVFNDGLVINYTDVGDIIKQIQKKSAEHGIEFMWYSPIPLCMFNTITHDLGNKGCAACDGLLSVAPNGDVLPCSSYDQAVGNLIESDFSEVWEGKDAKYFREKKFAHELCSSCDSLAACNGACPLYWRSLGYQELYKTLELKAL